MKDLFELFNQKLVEVLGKETEEEKKARLDKGRKDDKAKAKKPKTEEVAQE